MGPQQLTDGETDRPVLSCGSVSQQMWKKHTSLNKNKHHSHICVLEVEASSLEIVSLACSTCSSLLQRVTQMLTASSLAEPACH